MFRRSINLILLPKSMLSARVRSLPSRMLGYIMTTYIDTVLAYKQRNRVGRFAPPAESQASEATPQVDITIGSRCQVESNEAGLNKRGTVRFFGKTKFAKGEGVWVGIEYDEPMGKNDGS